MTWSYWRRIRQSAQILALVSYTYLLFAALQRRTAFFLADLFFRLDPLAALGATLASRTWIPRLALALITLGLTLIFGRVWCGWLCPLGTLLEWVRFRSVSHSVAAASYSTVSPRWRTTKNILLLLIISMALFGNLSLLIFDPLALLTRTMTTAVLPALNHAVSALERALYAIGPLQPAVDWAEELLRGPILPVDQPVFSQNALIIALFIGILALNVFADRFWCRYLCPLGALLGLFSKVSLLRPVVGEACNRCARCAGVCRVDAIDTRRGYDIIPTECTVCLDCLAACPENRVLPALSVAEDRAQSTAERRLPKSGLGFQWHWRPDPFRETDPSRRQALAALVTGAASVSVLSTDTQAQRSHPLLIRPPGAQAENDFLARCLRCSQCMKVCPTSGLQPTLSEAGLEGLWTPRLVSRLGYCDYGCNACGRVCPSGAIPNLDLARKRDTVIGMAVIDRDRCWPWAYGIPCIVCEEMCPTPEKAIRLEEAPAINDRGDPVIVQRPYVLQSLCIGCGICEFQCPVDGDAAIQVYRLEDW